MKILSSELIREADAYTIKTTPIASLDLMEQAATYCFKAIQKQLGKKMTGHPIHVFCGVGNNGGDGLVLARLFHNAGYRVTIYVCRYSNKSTSDFKVNYNRACGLDIKNKEIDMEDDLPSIKKGWIIDALFGSGLNRPPRGLAAATIKHINNQQLPVIAIDLPSGLFSDLPAHYDKDKTISANYTFSFQVPKLAFFMEENSPFVGDWFIVDIGLDKKFIESLKSDYYFLVPKKLRKMIRVRKKFESKIDFGHTVLIGGDVNKAGAIILSGKGAIRSGAGLVTLIVPEKIMATVHQAIPEIMCIPVGEDFIRNWDYRKLPKKMNRLGIGFGPGMGLQSKTKDFVRDMLQDSYYPLVIDADGLNIIAEDNKLLDEVPAQSILTPHIGEFIRLTGKYKNDFELLKKQIEFSKKHKLIVVLKGAYTRISTPMGKVFFNPTSNPGMATAGSGDVLTGIITGLLKQYKNPIYAAILGVYLHGKAGDFALKSESYESMTATDITNNLGKAFKHLHSL